MPQQTSTVCPERELKNQSYAFCAPRGAADRLRRSSPTGSDLERLAARSVDGCSDVERSDAGSAAHDRVSANACEEDGTGRETLDRQQAACARHRQTQCGTAAWLTVVPDRPRIAPWHTGADNRRGTWAAQRPGLRTADGCHRRPPEEGGARGPAGGGALTSPLSTGAARRERLRAALRGPGR